MSGPAAPPSPAPARPLLVYDGDCGFCLRSVARSRRRTGDRVDYAPSQRAVSADPRVRGVPAAAFRDAVFLFEPGGRSSRAAEAVLRTLALAPAAGWRLPLLLYRFVPGVAPVCEAVYRFVATHRTGVLRLERLLVGDVLAPTFVRSRALFRRGLALVALIAFLSLWVQIDGLSGSHGIAPVAGRLDDFAAQVGARPWRLLPTLLWLGASDGVLHGLCAGGVALSLVMLCDVAPALCAALLWAVYLSLLLACAPFLNFQWDTLLTETLLLAVWLLPWRLRRERRAPTVGASAAASGGAAGGAAGDAPPAPLARWLLWWLAFRLLFESGVVKLTSGDSSWSDLTALTFHYLTQPLPHVVSWFAWQLPAWCHAFCTVVMFVIELAVPFAVFAPRRLRHAGCALLLLLQVLIAGTGNYGFFNLLTIVLCLSLLDDQALAALAPRRLFARRREPRVPREAGPACGVPSADGGELPPFVPERREPALKRWLLAAFAVPVLVVSVLQVHDLFLAGRRAGWDQLEAGVLPTLLHDGPAAAARVLEADARRFASVNSYGLFRVMTRDRPEIVIEGSVDGETWVEYPFRWKPGDVNAPPHWAQPHMPRLDWQLWFEALDWQPATQPLRPYQPHDWFVQFLERLRDGEPAVVGLLARDPFDGRKPVAVRATLFDYRFTTSAERAATGAWWARQRLYPVWLTLNRP